MDSIRVCDLVAVLEKEEPDAILLSDFSGTPVENFHTVSNEDGVRICFEPEDHAVEDISIAEDNLALVSVRNVQLVIDGKGFKGDIQYKGRVVGKACFTLFANCYAYSWSDSAMGVQIQKWAQLYHPHDANALDSVIHHDMEYSD